MSVFDLLLKHWLEFIELYGFDFMTKDILIMFMDGCLLTHVYVISCMVCNESPHGYVSIYGCVYVCVCHCLLSLQLNTVSVYMKTYNTTIRVKHILLAL